MPTPRRQTHRDALLIAAKTLLRDSGRATITARDLVAASDTNLGSISYHFGSKDALLDEAARMVFEEWAQTVARTTSMDPNTPPMARLARSLEMVIDEFEALRPYFLGFIEIVARAARSPKERHQLVVHYRKQRTTVARMVSESLGDMLKADDAKNLASLLMAISDGLMLQCFIDPEQMPNSRQLTAASRDAFVVALRLASPDAERASTAAKTAGAAKTKEAANTVDVTGKTPRAGKTTKASGKKPRTAKTTKAAGKTPGTAKLTRAAAASDT